MLLSYNLTGQAYLPQTKSYGLLILLKSSAKFWASLYQSHSTNDS